MTPGGSGDGTLTWTVVVHSGKRYSYPSRIANAANGNGPDGVIRGVGLLGGKEFVPRGTCLPSLSRGAVRARANWRNILDEGNRILPNTP